MKPINHGVKGVRLMKMALWRENRNGVPAAAMAKYIAYVKQLKGLLYGSSYNAAEIRK